MRIDEVSILDFLTEQNLLIERNVKAMARNRFKEIALSRIVVLLSILIRIIYYTIYLKYPFIIED